MDAQFHFVYIIIHFNDVIAAHNIHYTLGVT